MEIVIDDIKKMLPESDGQQPTDEYYLTLAKYVSNLWETMRVFPEIDGKIRKHVVVALVSYFQDVVADAGLWRSFVRMCRHLYGKPVPFYKEPDSYVDYELNLIDVKFVLWYTLESRLGFQGLVSPFDADIDRFSAQVYKLFDFLYEEAPAAKNFQKLLELDLADKEQVRDIFKVSGWLFWNSYLLRPVSKHAYEQDVEDVDELTLEETLTDEQRLRTTFEQPTGPLALFTEEWLRLMVENKLPKDSRKASTHPHRYYQALTAATGGEPIAFCAGYAELEDFLSSKLGWGENPEGHLPQLKQYRDFVLYADSGKGLLVAHDIASFIKHPKNPLYDAALAAENAYRLVMEPALCPVDLLKYLFRNELVPDACYPSGKKGRELLQTDWDFFARMYLRNFYRAE